MGNGVDLRFGRFDLHFFCQIGVCLPFPLTGVRLGEIKRKKLAVYLSVLTTVSALVILALSTHLGLPHEKDCLG
jgi:hypothetical protein